MTTSNKEIGGERMRFKSQKEIFRHLLNGGKIKRVGASNRYYFLNKEGHFVLDDNYSAEVDFDYPNTWEEYTEPKKKERVTLYRYTVKDTDGEIYQSKWTNQSLEEVFSRRVFLIKTESKEIDIEE